MPFSETLISTTETCSIKAGLDLIQRREEKRTAHLLATRELSRDANFRQLVNLRKLNLSTIKLQDYFLHLSMAQTKSGPFRMPSAHGASLSKLSSMADRIGMETSIY
ncbi:hypothetical protein X970_07360 [Pseudomonas monteilii SB3101]|uniref:Uncharacterized protein n=1 Tax=Pseudomonas monteilii SB3101 TaxID=1435058 RepID=V9V7Z8_9PSED|nr:hypothetical protein X969_07385 [Pseudomonas monteilii SB3078]AHC91041.1 hypothetical protein X970_07360 [Pseudomonas monteilii SB3101]